MNTLTAVRNSLRGRLLDPELLRTFVAVVDCGGHTAAAQYLHRTQAAVSQQINRLEEAVAVQLFELPRKNLKLTDKGETLLVYARRLIALNAAAFEELQPGIVSGIVRMGATNYYATSVLPSVLAQFSSIYPGVHIDMEVGVADEMQKKLGASLDLTINAFPGKRNAGVLLRRDPVVWVASKKVSLTDKDPVPLAVLPVGSLLRRWAEEALTQMGRRWVVVQESSSVEVLKASVLAGLAIGVFQRASVRSTKGLRLLTPADGFTRLPSSEMWLECANRELSPAARCLYGYLKEQLPPWEARAMEEVAT